MTETTKELTPAARARAARTETIKTIRSYVRKRLIAETEQRGAAAAIADATSFTSSFIAQVRLGKNDPGEEFCRAMAEYWGLSYEQLEDVARADAAMEGATTQPHTA